MVRNTNGQIAEFLQGQPRVILTFDEQLDRKLIEKVTGFDDVLVVDVKTRQKLKKWLKWDRDKADWLDPLTEKENELLG